MVVRGSWGSDLRQGGDLTALGFRTRDLTNV